METIVNFLHEWAIPGLLLCILILVIIGIRQHRVNNSANEEDNESSGEGDFRLPRKVLRMRKPAMPRRNKLPQ